MKIITVCGSYKYIKEIKEVAEKLALEGNCVITPIDITRPKDEYTKEEILQLGKMHKEKIRISDAIYVVNVDGYIGSNTQSEIDLAKELGKEIMYYTDNK
jgi:hypothetical protein